MTDQQINEAIAEHLGWLRPEHPDCLKLKAGWSMPEKWWMDPKGVLRFGHDIPNYYSDLNLWFHIEHEMTDEEFNTYCLNLCGLQDSTCYPPTIKDLRAGINATAADKCKAYLKMKGLWV